MLKFRMQFKIGQPTERYFTLGDLLVIFLIAVVIYIGVRFAVGAPAVIQGPRIILSPGALPWYTFLSLGRMFAAYVLSMIFTLIYGRMAAYNRTAEKILLPLLDVMQSVPILSFLPVVVLSFSAIFPTNFAAELGSVILIFTSQVWNLTFSWYQSITTIPKELREAGTIFRFNGWFRLKTLESPFAMIGLIWNSMMSWAGGWFFLMAAEIFTVGHRDFRLPGLGSYLQEAANQGNFPAIFRGLATLILVIVALDQLVWRPLLSWSNRFKMEMVYGEEPPSSWFYDVLHNSHLILRFRRKIFTPVVQKMDMFFIRKFPASPSASAGKGKKFSLNKIIALLFAGGLIFGIYRAVAMMTGIPGDQWGKIGISLLATLLRVFVTLFIAFAWTLPLGVAIGTNKKLEKVLGPAVQILASLPATALFPVFLLFLLHLPAGLNISAVLLMLMGTQWYLLFNIIAGASSIPQDLKYTSTLLQLGRWERWRRLILPALFPYLITGAIAASGGAWNASIIAEHVEFGGETYHTIGIGASIAGATASGNYSLLLAATLSMVLTVVLINRFLWRRLFKIAEERYRLD